MKIPWKTIVVFAVCAIVVFASMAAFTVEAIRSEHERLRVSAEAQQAESVNLALWRMDTLLAPIVAAEVARPYHAYTSAPSSLQSDQEAAGTGFGLDRPYVLFHFQWHAHDGIFSPEFPNAAGTDSGSDQAGNPAEYAELVKLARSTDFETLLAKLPKDEAQWLVSQRGGQGESVETDANSSQNVLSNAAAIRSIQTWQSKVQSTPRTKKPDILARGAPYQIYAGNTRAGQRAGGEGERQAPLDADLSGDGGEDVSPIAEQPSIPIREGVSQAIWVQEMLLLARRVRVGNEIIIQGCRLNWDRLHPELLREAHEVLPAAELEPIASSDDVSPMQILAGLPLRIVPPQIELAKDSSSSFRKSMLVAWASLVCTTGAIGAVLLGALSLSERRSAFVSAVTHELRTPLTTFRLYTEMLSSGMIEDDQKRQEYLDTLHSESDRLTHLVDNVLAYARLERGHQQASMSPHTMASIVDQVTRPLMNRAALSEMNLSIQIDDAAKRISLTTSPGIIEQILGNLVDNSAKYAGRAEDKQILIDVTCGDGFVEFSVRDFGPGIPRDEAKRLFRPFHKSAEAAAASAPGVGLGLALSRRLAKRLGGTLRFESAEPGARFVLRLPSAT